MKRLAAAGIYVQDTDVSRPGELRPFLRNVQWIELANGRETKSAVDFANAHTPESRAAQHIPPANVSAASAEVIHVDFELRQQIS
jgi:hypothetical protein